jgi:rod shape determining protein RodA
MMAGLRAMADGVSRWRLDPWLLALLMVLMALSLVLLYSAGEQSMALVQKQAVRFAVGLAALFVLAQLSRPMLVLMAPWAYAAALLMLVVTLWLGVGTGAQRWLDLGVVRFQPSEAMKLALPLMLAAWLSERPLPPHMWGLIGGGALIAVPTALIIAQPDLGSGLLLLGCGLGVLFVAGLSWRLIGLSALAMLAAAPLLWVQLLDYQRSRVLVFLNPERDPLGEGWNIIQSKIAVGSGGWSGKGWLSGSQSHLEFLPEPHTDFIFAVLAEEFGWLGVAAVLALYTLIMLRALHLAVHARDAFARLLGGGLMAAFFLYVLVNAAMVSGLMPVVGVPLPLVSYGGTSAATILAGFGLIMGQHSRRRMMA